MDGRNEGKKINRERERESNARNNRKEPKKVKKYINLSKI